MGGAAGQTEFRYTYPKGEKKEGETAIYNHDCMEMDEPLVGLEYETIDTIKKGF